MTDLQASLLLIGGAIVVGVISYNKWQEYKAKKSVERAFSSAHDDVLMQPDDADEAVDRLEPRLDAVTDASAAGAQETAAPVAVPPPAPTPVRELPVDEIVDCMIPFALENPVRGEKILPALQGLSHAGNKPVHFVGLESTRGWEPVTHGGVYAEMQAGVQLANRSGALNELEYSELVARLRQFADGLGAELDVPDMSKVMTAARALHRFVDEYSAQLGINVRANGAPWALDTLLAALERQGFDLRPEGRLVMPDGDGGVLFSLSTNVTLAAQSTQQLTLLLDVPRVAAARDGYGAMAACARSIAARLDGSVVDDSGQPLSDEALAEIAGQVEAFYDNMETAGVPAGSTRALRLFS
ncbi:MAG: cell division protein ZipA C-terminal FtsZ-binding domain-containing protein [Burkholderiaceae bacterium]